MKNRSTLATALAGLCVLAGCSGRTDVSLTGNTPAQYSHVWITTQEVWFNTSAVAGPDGGGWRKFTLSTPATVDLVGQNNGTLGSVVTGLNITPGTYAQVRLIPVDASAALTTSASTAGAIFNAEADYVDAGGTTHQLPLELLNPEKGIGMQASLRVPVGNVSAAVGGVGIGGSTANTSQDASFVTPTTNPTTDTPTTTPSTTATTTVGTTSTTPTVPPNEFAVTFDGARDLVPFIFKTPTGTPATPNAIMLSPHPAAYDLTQVGAISGTLTLTNLSGASSESGNPSIEASAEVLSADGSRHVVVSSTPVQADGTFMLYPLAASSGHIPEEYDVVIHGPGIATIIVKSVQLFQNSVTATPTAGTDATIANGTGTMGATDTTVTATTSTTTTTSNTTITPVSIGTLVPRAATAFSAALASGATALPSGAAVSFYQKIDRAGEVPYVIETSTFDPFQQVMPFAQSLSTGTIDSGTWSTSGGSVTTVSAAPSEGAGNYEVAATAPSYADGALGTEVKAPQTTTGTPPPTTTATAPQTFTLAPMTLASGSAAGTVSATVTEATPNRYDAGELLLTHDGTLVASASLDVAFTTGGGTVVLHNVPAGTSSAVYYVTVRAWSTKDTSVPVQRQSYPGALDMSSTPSGLLQLTVN